MTYEIKEYNQEPVTEENQYPEMYTDKSFPLFYSIVKVVKYLEENFVYGKVFEYDDTEYAEYHNESDDDFDAEIPEPTNEWVTSDLIEG